MGLVLLEGLHCVWYYWKGLATKQRRMVSLGHVKFDLLMRLSKEGVRVESSNEGLELRTENWVKQDTM